MNNLRKFNTIAEYDSATINTPSVSWVLEDDSLHYAAYVPPTPTFQGKWEATYEDGSILSAECDSTSAISKGEITLTNLQSVEFGECVTSIGTQAFMYCRSLTSITIPDSVTYIGEYAFYGCGGLTSITVEATIPPTLASEAFYNTNNCPIYVPAASVDAYKSATNWSRNPSRIFPIP